MHFGERIRQAREIRAWTQEELAIRINRSKSLLAQIEAGFKVATNEFLGAVAFATKLPLTFFNEEPHPELPISEVLFRAPRKIKRRDVLDAVRYAEYIVSIYSIVARNLKPIPCNITEVKAHPAEAARIVKKALGLGLDVPMTSLIRPLERAGVCFAVLPPMNSREAFSVWLTQGQPNALRPLIAYSIEPESVDRTRLSIAHELGHLIMHRSFLRKAHAEIEEEAFSFAAEWLMPEAAMREVLRGPITLTSLAKLKPIWGTSIAALVRRAFHLNIITERQYHYLFQQMGNHGWKTREPEGLDIPVEKPRLFRKMVETVYGNPINYASFSADTHVSAQELRRILMNYEPGVSDEKGSAAIKPNVLKFSR